MQYGKNSDRFSTFVLADRLSTFVLTSSTITVTTIFPPAALQYGKIATGSAPLFWLTG